MEMPSSENAEHSTIISNDAADHPKVVPDDPAEHPRVIPIDVVEDATTISNDVDYHIDNMVDDVLDHGMETKYEIEEDKVKQTLEAIATTGKFWLDWEKLRSMLSFQLKQVLSEYPEAKVATEQQSCLGETFEELRKRLDEELLNFVEGPPFTLQRLCEILLAAQSIYPKLSKLALALEKNLLVTSTLTIYMDSYPQTSTQQLDEANKTSEEPQVHSGLVQNGADPVIGDRDEIMAEVEEVTDIDEEMLVDMALRA